MAGADYSVDVASSPAAQALPPKSQALMRSVAGYERRTDRLDGDTRKFDESRSAYDDRRESLTKAHFRVAKRARDLSMVGSLTLALAAASRISGDSFTPLAWALITLAPTMILLAQTWPLTTRLELVDATAGRVRQEQALITVRRAWLARAVRIVCVLQRRPGLSAVTAINNNGEDVSAVIDRLLRAERKLRSRTDSKRYSAFDLAAKGWGSTSQILRSALLAGVAAGAINSVVFGVIGRPTPAIVSGLTATLFAIVRFTVSYSVVNRRAQRVERMTLWNKQRELLADLDKIVRTHADAMATNYEQHVVIDLRD